MKRLIPFLILAAFLLGVSGNGVGRSYVTVKIRSCHHSHPHLAKYLPCEEGSWEWDAADQSVFLPASTYTFKPSRHYLLPWECLVLTTGKHYTSPGLGCGGLPS
jgi:hypothetical protein